METRRNRQREATRRRLVRAAIQVFSELGFGGASTREVARRARASQSLLTYHFPSKELLWQAAADDLFGRLRVEFDRAREMGSDIPPRAREREMARQLVRFSARNPEFFRFLLEVGRSQNERMEWLVDTHLTPIYREFTASRDEPPELLAHVFYAIAGASSTLFSVAAECERLTGLDPTTEEAIETHAELIARLFER
ncbi:MAG: TetR/AcrR family transcriptional regulator [Acidobacteriota bacterium]